MSNKIRKEPTLEEHVHMGADIKAAIKAIHKVLGWSHYFYAKHVDGLVRCDDWLDRVRSNLEDRMFYEYRWLSNEQGFSVYYTKNLHPTLQHYLNNTTHKQDQKPENDAYSTVYTADSIDGLVDAVCSSFDSKITD